MEKNTTKPANRRSIPRPVNRRSTEVGTKANVKTDNPISASPDDLKLKENKTSVGMVSGTSTAPLKNVKSETEAQARVRAGQETKSSSSTAKSNAELSKNKVSLQGPFNPSVIANLKDHEDHKRKRPEISPILEVPYPVPKRNPSKQKQKCQVEFSTKADTKFGTGNNLTSVFSAKGLQTKGYFTINPLDLLLKPAKMLQVGGS